MIRQLLCLLVCAVALLSGSALAANTEPSESSEPSVSAERAQPHYDNRRVVSMAWEITESLLAMGITPLGAADGPDYRQYVVHPELPESVVNVGSRLEPNLELLAALQPSVILISPLLADLKPVLERIAPVWQLNTYGQTHDNLAAARQYFLELGERLGKSEQANAALYSLDEQLGQYKAALARQYPQGIPPVLLLRFGNAKVSYLYGENSLPLAALRAIGADTESPAASTFWGAVQKPVTELAAEPSPIKLYFLPFAEKDTLFASPLWQAMPFVQQGCVGPIASTWSYGGIISLGYLADSISKALLALPNQGRQCRASQATLAR
ncbi:iron-siderophore ABC transporter substrate-binding protein [Pokkaliibacter sp. CJK22405]|uniref:iron-siderophore ABC transporter substrate-binding protein n=1 Tax=Pokkaliibacter sp. CJK22405 TaxID=3384615 RepID=UPI0039850AC1